MKKFVKIFVLILLLSCVLAAGVLAFTACGEQDNKPFIPTEHFEGNCITKGYTRYYLSNGTYIDRPDEEFGEHEYEQAHVSTVSCTEDGIERFTCKLCNDTYDETTPKLNHDYKVTETKAADCHNDGYTSYKCERCQNEYTATIDKIEHDYKISASKEPTLDEDGFNTFTCELCGDSYTDTLPMKAHDYVQSVLKKPTCTQEGTMLFHCNHCDDEYTESIPKAPHTSDTEALHDDDNHWYICKVCNDTFGAEAHDLKLTTVPATCMEKAYTKHACTDCKYFYDVIDENSALAEHEYEAYTCKTCQRDEMLQYLNEFNSKGTETRRININSENKFVLFLDYLILYRITEYKYFETTYITLTTANVSQYLTAINRSITATNWAFDMRYNYIETTGEVLYIYARVNNTKYKLSEVATITPDKYADGTHVQFDSFQYDDSKAKRSETFDNFAYKTRVNTLNVTKSDDLFYAFEHGYNPIPASGSAADRMLQKAKAVSRRIISDDMTDVQKIKAIYTYLISDVAYDHGVIDVTNNGQPFTKYTSYYLEGVFDHGIAVCDGISKAFCVLAGIENIKCVRVISENHAWNKSYIDINGDGQKQWYASDATWGNQSIGYDDVNGEYMSVDDFLFTDVQKILAGQTALNYKDITASDEANPFEHFYFDEERTSDNDYVIESNLELRDLISCLKQTFGSFTRGAVVTVQLFVSTDYCINKSEIESAIQSAITVSWILASTYSISIDRAPKTYGDISGYCVTLLFPKTY